jgi:integrase
MAWLAVNPMRDVQKASLPPARRRRVPQREIDAVVAELAAARPGRKSPQGFLLGIETAMRAGEMWSLERGQIDLKAGVVHLLKTKNGDQRDVALTPAAIGIIEAHARGRRPRLFTTTSAVRDALFRKARDAAGVKNLHFHDSRAEAIFRLSSGSCWTRSSSPDRSGTATRNPCSTITRPTPRRSLGGSLRLHESPNLAGHQRGSEEVSEDPDRAREVGIGDELARLRFLRSAPTP